MMGAGKTSLKGRSPEEELMSVLLKGGKVVSPENTVLADLRMEGEKIVEIGPDLSPGNSEVVDVSGCLLFPGFIDGHTHLDMEGAVCHTADDFATGSAAAIAGGTTSVIDFAAPERGQSLQSGLDAWHALAEGKSACDYAFHMSLLEWNEDIAAEIPRMFDQGVSSFKVYMAYDNLRVSDGAIFALMNALKERGGMLGCHCENGDLVDALAAEQKAAGNLSPAAHPLSRPDTAEAEAVGRFLALARTAELPVNIVHLSCLKSMEAVRRARGEGQKVYVETCPQYLLLDDSCYQGGFEGAKYVCAPPLRPDGNPQMLWQAVERGEVDTISTDHCSFRFGDQKALGREDFGKIPGGLPGVEHRPALIYTYGVAAGRISAGDMAALLSENIAKQFGMYPRKGVLAEGSDADVVVWDPGVPGSITAEEQQQNVDYSPYEGFLTIGKARRVYLRGELAAENGSPTGAIRGTFIHRGSCI